MRIKTKDIVAENIEKIEKLFPSVVTESKDPASNKLKKLIDFDKLRQILSNDIVDGGLESYDFTWPGKKKAIIEANLPINKTLRPCEKESKDWSTTKNLYLEGDNLEVLKILQESYLGKIKVIYIDPPYNTGKDFIYRDNFRETVEEYEESVGAYNDDGDRMFKNTNSNGRFHSDWNSMMYSRLKLARNLLNENGFIFISIDDNELDNLSKICSEIFSEQNFVCRFIWEKTANPNVTFNNVGIVHEYILCYSKDASKLNLLKLDKEDYDSYNRSDEYLETRGPYKLVGLNKTGTLSDLRPNLQYEIEAPDGSFIKPSPRWRWSKEKLKTGLAENRVVFNKSGNKWTIYYKQYLNEDTEGNIVERGALIKSIINDCGRTTDGSSELSKLIDRGIFDFPKPVDLIKRIIDISSSESDIILDFFSGSATTAHAVMQLNAEDGGNRKFIMIQLSEDCAVDSKAYKSGFANICEIGKERIRRAGEFIKNEVENKEKQSNLLKINRKKILDVGFRVFKIDSTNMKDVYFSPQTYKQSILEDVVNNIKENRSDMDLLYGVLLDWGFEISLPHITEIIDGKKVHIVDSGALIACFETSIDKSVIEDIANQKPAYVVFRDSSFSDSPEKINLEEIFKMKSPETKIKII